MIKVFNMITDDKSFYDTPDPAHAVMCAHAQECGNFNTWEYVAKYAQKIFRGMWTVSCGDWIAFHSCPWPTDVKEAWRDL